jgi:REP element-mobilizing transposase RayT
MPRKNRITEPGYYHVISRGVEKRNVFLEEKDYNYFLDTLLEVFKKYSVILHSFVLMTNHYHLLLETSQHNISDVMRRVNSLYSIYFNKKYKRVGHLWQGRFQSYYLYDDTHFWIVAKYIERNPIKAKMVNSVSEYKYQSFYQWRFKKEYYSLLENSKIFEMTLKEYEEFISTQMQSDISDTVFATPKLVTKDGKLKILQRRLETFFEYDRDINRNANIKKSYEYGYTKADIANFLDISHTAIAKIVQKL